MTWTTPTIAGTRKASPRMVSTLPVLSDTLSCPGGTTAGGAPKGYEQRRGRRRAKQRPEEDVPLHSSQLRKATRERHRKQEREEHLYSGQDDPELLQELD